MSNLDFTISCIVTFFSKKRRTSPPNLNYGMYYPHIVIKGTEEYLGINFIDGEDVIFDKPIQANALPVYETVDYSAIQAGAEFPHHGRWQYCWRRDCKKLSFSINHGSK